VNFDGAWIESEAGVGMIVRNCNDECLKAERRRVEARCVYEAELMGAWLATIVVHAQFNSERVIVEGDSLMVINDIKKRSAFESVHPLLCDFWGLLDQLTGWEVTHVRRNGNKGGTLDCWL